MREKKCRNRRNK